MNVFLPKTVFSLLAGVFLLLLVPVMLEAQTKRSDQLTALKDTPAKYYFEGILTPGGIITQAKNGVAIVDQSMTVPAANGGSVFTIVYTPKPGFVGRDTFEYNVRTCPSGLSCYQEVSVAVTVRLSKVDAVDDLYYMPSNGSSISLNVLGNDKSDAGGLKLMGIAATNNGMASFTEGSPNVDFKAAPGFSGISKLIYTVCDKSGACDQGSVSIFVDRQDRSKPDTFRVFTVKNDLLDVLIPGVYTLIEQPLNGLFDNKTDVPTYRPNSNFSGKDYMIFQDGSAKIVVEVTVLDRVRNKYAFGDRGDVLPGKSVEIDVLKNDAYGYGAGCISVAQAKFGRITYDDRNKGIVSYRAPNGFIGVDEFTYTSYPPGCGGVPEVAKVLVYVSNYEPAAPKFVMTTPKATPLVISYNAPVSDFQFRVQKQSLKGKVVYLQGPVDSIILGQRVQGHNLLLYIPSSTASGTDEFEVSYCTAGESANCKNRRTVKIEVNILNISNPDGGPSCFADCVWAGDMNRDGIVSLGDLLSLGQTLGEIGPKRSQIDANQWYGQSAAKWNNPYYSGPDLENMDSNGDGFITAADTTAIGKFYGKTKAIIPTQLPYNLYDVRINGDTEVEPGGTFNFELVMGDSKTPVIDFYGMVMNVPYNKDFFKSFDITFDDQSWLAYNSAVVSMTKNNPGAVEAALTRVNRKPVSGRGRIARGKGIVVDIIDGVGAADQQGPSYIEFPGGTAIGIGPNGEQFGITIAPYQIQIKRKEDTNKPYNGINGRPLTQQKPNPIARIYPNPAINTVRIDFKTNQEIQRLQVFNTMGSMVQEIVGNGNPYAEINVSDWNNGIYFVKAYTKNGVVGEKFEVLK
jgi:hypothetical protein